MRKKKKIKKRKKFKKKKAQAKEATVSIPATTVSQVAAAPPTQPVLARSLSISYGVDVLQSCGLAGAAVVCDGSDIPYDCELTQVT